MKTIIVKCKVGLKKEELHDLANKLAAENRKGCVVLPQFCELLCVGETRQPTVIAQTENSVE